jgi:hypothetical protein
MYDGVSDTLDFVTKDASLKERDLLASGRSRKSFGDGGGVS